MGYTGWNKKGRGKVQVRPNAGGRSPRTTLSNFLDTACSAHIRVYRVRQAYDAAALKYARLRRPYSIYMFAPDPRIHAGQWAQLTRAAELIDELGATDTDFVMAQFKWFDKVFSKLPGIHQLSTPAAVERYAEYKKASKPARMKTLDVSTERSYYDKQLNRATRSGVDLEEAIRRGVLAGVIPEWYAKERLGSDWTVEMEGTDG